MPADRTKEITIVVSAVDRVTEKFKDINKAIANSQISQLNNSLRRGSSELGLREIGKAFSEVGHSAGEVVSRTRELAEKIGLLGLASGAGFLGLSVEFGKFGNEVSDAAQKLGISTSKYQEYTAAARIAGIEQDAFTSSLGKFSKNIGEAAAGGGEARVAFDAMGIALRGQNGKLRTLDALLPDVTSKLSSIQNAQVRAAFGTAIFGKQFGEIVPLVNEFNEATAKAREFVISPEQIQRGDEFNKKWQELELTFSTLSRLAGAELLPGLQEGIIDLKKFLVENKDGIESFFRAIGQQLPAIVKNLAEAIKFISGFFVTFNANTRSTELNLGRIKLVFAALAALLVGPLALSLVQLVASFGGVGLQIGLLGFRVLGLVGILPTALNTIGRFSSGISVVSSLLSGIFTRALSLFSALGIGMISPLGAAVGALGALVALGVLLYKNWEPFRDLIDGVWMKIKELGTTVAQFFGFQQGAVGGPSPSLMAAGPAIQTIARNTNTRQEANVKVSFDNLPKGTRIQSENPGGLNLDLTRGYSMVTP